MDRAAVRLLNQLLGNGPNASVLELHFPAGEFLFENAIAFAIGGGDFAPQLSRRSIDAWTSYVAAPGDILRFQNRVSGQRAYLAVDGGFDVETWLGSSSTNLAARVGGFDGRGLKVGDRLRCRPATNQLRSLTLGPSMVPKYRTSPTVRVTTGPEFETLTAISIQTLLNEAFYIASNSDRMGFRLTGPTLHSLSDKEMLSSGVTFGTVQLLPDGQMIVLMADHQTTGGYPRIATVISTDLPLLAQSGPGDTVAFELIEVEHAESLAVEFERNITCLRTGIRLKADFNL